MRWGQFAVLAVWAVVAVASLPRALSLTKFAFWDQGWALNVDAMLDDGFRPVADFGYYYGLLTLAVNRAVFGVFGRTPEALAGFFVACGLGVALGVVRVMRSADVRGVAALFLVAGVPLYANASLLPSPAHALEVALLTHALAFHAAGRPVWALALVTAAVFVKPSLGYVYGLVLLVLILAGWPGGGSRWRRLLPAAGVGVTLLAGLAAAFGWEAVVRTQFPLDGMKVYREMGFGFFRGIGRQFWRPDRPPPFYYLLTVAGVWLASSAVLVVLAVGLLPRFRHPTANAVVACAALHVVFVCALFGNPTSWIYYPSVLFIGTAVGLNEFARRPSGPGSPESESAGSGLVAWCGASLVALAAVGQVMPVWVADAVSWARWGRVREASGLFATPADAADWAALAEAGRGKPVLVLTQMGGARFLSPGCENPRSWCLMRSLATPAELDRVRAQIAAADFVLQPNFRYDDFFAWPELAGVLAPFRPVRETGLYTLYGRQPGPPEAPR